MILRRLKCVGLSTAFFTMAVTTGCAVLTVDVDVYKGPLANQRTVQRQRIAGLAMGAKPLLVDLRNRLELQECWRLDNPTDSITLEKFEKFRAHALVEHKRDPERRSNKTTNHCASIHEVVGPRGSVGEVDKDYLVSPQARKVNEVLELFSPRGGRREPSLASYLEAVRGFESRFRDASEVLRKSLDECNRETVLANANARKELEDQIQERRRKFEYDDSPIYRSRTPEACKAVGSKVDELVSISDQVLYVTVDLLGLPSPNNATTDPLGELRPRLSRYVGELIDSRSLGQAVCGINAQYGAAGPPPEIGAVDTSTWDELMGAEFAEGKLTYCRGMESRLRYEWRIVQSTTPGSGDVDPASVEFPMFPFALAKTLEVGTIGQTQGRARTLSRLLRTSGQSWSKRSKLGRVGEYALKGEIPALQFVQSVSAFTANIQPKGALSSGRPHEGVEDLVNCYLQAVSGRHQSPLSANTACSDIGAESAYRALVAGLLNFSEKILFLANTERLLTESDDPTVRRYVRVLQAVGGSILSQIDESFRAQNFRDNPFDRNGTDERDNEIAAELVKQARLGRLRSVFELISKELDSVHLDSKPAGEVKNILDRTEPDLYRLRMTLIASQATRQVTIAAIRDLADQIGAVEVAGTENLKKERWGRVLARKDSLNGSLDTEEIRQAVAPAWTTPECDILMWVTDRCLFVLGNIKTRLKKELRDREEPAARIAQWIAALDSSSLLMPDQKQSIVETYSMLAETLRLRHIEAKAAGVSDTRNIEEAIRLTDEYRSGRLYIRPAMAFLRDSYPASDLQDDGAVFWKNLLGEQTVRSVPGFGYASSPDLKVQAAIDKAYWQTVNQVRVSGMNKTTYAITKDDVGNWYVKGYSVDPKNLIESFKKVALFSMRGDVRQTLLSTAVSHSDGTKASPNDTTQPKSILQEQYDLHLKEHEKRTVSLLRALKKELADDNLALSLTGSTRSAAADSLDKPDRDQFRAGGDYGDKALIESFATSASASESIGPTSSKKIADVIVTTDFEASSAVYGPADAVTDLLTSVNRYGREQIEEVSAKVKGAKPGGWPEGAASPLRKGIAMGVRRFVQRYLDRLESINRELESSLLIVGKPLEESVTRAQ